MAKYIHRKALFKAVDDYASTHPVMSDNELFALFCSIPAEDVAPVRHGRWYRFTKVSIDPQSGLGFGRYMWKCDVCNVGEEETKMPYCPNCGARMDGGET